MKQIFKAMIIAILAAFLFIFVVFYIVGSSALSRLDVALMGGMVASAVSFWSLLLVGIPMHLALLKVKVTSVYIYAIAGAVPSSASIFILKPLGQDTFNTLLLQSLLFGVTGIVVALTFRHFAINNTHNKAFKRDSRKNGASPLT